MIDNAGTDIAESPHNPLASFLRLERNEWKSGASVGSVPTGRRVPGHFELGNRDPSTIR